MSQPATDAIRAHFDTLYAGASPGESVCILTATRSNDKCIDPRSAFFSWPAQREAAVRHAVAEDERGREVYACAHRLTRQRRWKEDAAPVDVLWAECDHDRWPDGLPPSYVVESSPGKRHVYLRLKRAIDPNKAEELNRRLALLTDADDGWHLTKLLRPAGTHNHKYADQPAVAILAVTEDAYDPDDLDRNLPQLPEQPAPPSSSRPTAAYAGDDKDLLEKARRSKQGPAFTALYDRGDASPYGGDQSAADLALCNMLAFWYGGDDVRIDAMFRGSALMRPKWDERHYADGRTYGQATIAKALSTVRDHYDPRRQREPAEEWTWEKAVLQDQIKRERADKEAAISLNREFVAATRRSDLPHATRINMVNAIIVLANLDQTEPNTEGVAHRRPLSWFAQETGSCDNTVKKALETMESGLGYWVDDDGNRCDPGIEGTEFVTVPLLKRTTRTEYKNGQRYEVSYFERTPEAGATAADTLRAANAFVAHAPRRTGPKEDPNADVIKRTETWDYWWLSNASNGEVFKRGRKRHGKPRIEHGYRQADGTIDWLPPGHAAGPHLTDCDEIETANSHSAGLSLLTDTTLPHRNPFDEVPKGKPVNLPPPLMSQPTKRDCAKCGRRALPGLIYCEHHDYLLGGPPPRRKEQPVAQARFDAEGRPGAGASVPIR